MPEAERRAIGARGRDWVVGHFNPAAVAAQTLRLYAEVIAGAASARRRRRFNEIEKHFERFDAFLRTFAARPAQTR